MQELSAARGANHNVQLAHLKNTEKKKQSDIDVDFTGFTDDNFRQL